MKVKLLLISLICTQSIYGSDVINLLQEANRLADDLVKVVGVTSEKSKPLSEIVPVIPVPLVIDLDRVIRYSDIQIPILSPVVMPVLTGSLPLNIHGYELPYFVGNASAPQDINYRNNLIELPVLQQNRGVWEGNDVNMGIIGGRNITYTMAQLRGADGLNCGYHALKNVIYALAACKKLEQGATDEAQKLLYRMQDIQSFTQLLTPWLQFVIPYRYEKNNSAYRRYPLGNFPSGTELEKLLGEDRSQPRIPQDLENVFDDGLHAHILILDSFFYVKDPMRASDKALQVLENIVNHENGLYGFVVNNAACEPLATARGAHWFGYVLWKKNGKSSWLYTDSLFNPHDRVTSELMRICFQTSVEFNEFLANRDFAIINDPLYRIETNLGRLLEGSNTGQNTLVNIFNQLLREPVGTLKWNRAIVDRVMQIVTLTLDYVVAHKAACALQCEELEGYVNVIFAKIREDAGNVKDEDIDLCMQKLEELRTA